MHFYIFQIPDLISDHLISELMSVPDDLRNVLKQCLDEDATPENLEVYLLTVRQIITALMHDYVANSPFIAVSFPSEKSGS